MIIREEQPEDQAGVYEVEALAFGRNAEADLVDELRKNGKVTLSLVAEEEGKILGHVLFSPGWIEGPGGKTAVEGMGPVAVVPDRQGQGIGSALIREALKQMRQAGRRLIIVEGNPRYYIRFGFIEATLFGITCEFNPPPGCFMVRALAEGALEGVSGTAHYAEEFRSVG
jgi:putative acetyltransferase